MNLKDKRNKRYTRISSYYTAELCYVITPTDTQRWFAI